MMGLKIIKAIRSANRCDFNMVSNKIEASPTGSFMLVDDVIDIVNHYRSEWDKSDGS